MRFEFARCFFAFVISFIHGSEGKNSSENNFNCNFGSFVVVGDDPILNGFD